MNQTNHPFFFFLLFPVFFNLALSNLNPKFEACEPKTCGNGPNITYPFYISGKQESYCGLHRFRLTCSPDGFPILNLSNSYNTVREIFYSDNSLRASNPIFSISNNSTQCLSPSKNLTLYGYWFEFAPKQKQISLLFNCETKGVEEYRIGCDGGNRTRSVLAMSDAVNETIKGYVKGKCGGETMKTMVDEAYDGDIWEALRRGFVLNWKNMGDCEKCQKSGGRCGFDGVAFSFRCYCRHGDHPDRCPSDRDSKSLALKLGLGIGLGIGIPGLIILWWWKRKYGNSNGRFGTRKRHGDPEEAEGSNLYFGVPVFSYTELEAATNNFDHTRELGDGGFGTVYYGKLQDGREVAVKRLYEQNFRRVEQFMNEVKILTRLRHKNLVSLYGCTSRHSRELLLVYEYVPNGTVAHHLHLHSDQTKPTILPWATRMKIALQSADALSYLHASGIIHRDVKTSNILLDDSFNVKMADFGLSRLFPTDVTHVSTAPQGTPGYVDPEYHRCYQLTNKSDVYSFGVVLIELISSMAAVDMSRDREEINLSSLAMRRIQRSELSELVDPSLGFENDEEVKRMVSLVAQLAFQCLQDKELRPSMDEVLENLKSIQSDRTSSSEFGDDYCCRPSEPPPVSPVSDEVGLLMNNRKEAPPSSPISVADKWDSKSTTPNVSA